MEFNLNKGTTYLIEFEVTEEIDALESDLLGKIFGQVNVDKIEFKKLWLMDSNSLQQDLLERIDRFADSLKDDAKHIFHEYE